jgi:hypothetical protein
MPKPQLRVDAEMLVAALESDHSEAEWFLDLQTGEVLPVTDPHVTGEDESLADEVEQNPKRYLPIDSLPSSEAFRIMEDFVASLEAGPIATRLAKALSRRHPFAEFKAALRSAPPIRDRWFGFHAARMLTLAEDWLAANVPRATLKSEKPSRPEA